ncbi:hypothetical protein PR003_g21706 [Phytophthora rubi]|uniref:Uncharacterized protein n=1 Tax=Phytophthora rubi TaxID=129364 RepID=A0A6A4DBV1_9STRA|nr:hypothetical protein PR002_g20114 [Phytophthora rubi]KAE8998993.1 hypothetical protein PR001_g19171 [Phytophthora rubi]KAE9304640.1 hypothetical protein PR003_g21706 [Phytophthora rubi]
MASLGQATNAPNSRSVFEAASRMLSSILEGPQSSTSSNGEIRSGGVTDIGCDVPSNLSDDDDDDDEISVNDIDFSVHETESVVHKDHHSSGSFRIDIDRSDPAKETTRKRNAQVKPSLPPIGKVRLDGAGARDTEDLPALVELRQRLGQALREVLSLLPRTRMTNGCQDAITNHAHTGEALDARVLEELQQLARVLQGDPVPRLSIQCYDTIDRMATSGQLLDMTTLKELQESRALEFCSDPPANYHNYTASKAQLSLLRAAVVECALATSELSTVPEVLALWELIHNSISSQVPAGTIERIEPRDEAYPPNTAIMSTQLLLVTGEVKQKDDSDGDDDGSSSGDNNNIFDASKAKVAAQNLAHKGLGGVQKKLSMDRRKVDAALRAMRDRRNILAGGCATAVMAYLPPLLRIEIMRDFFQITGLFFSGMYGPVFEFIRRFRPSSWILVAEKHLQHRGAGRLGTFTLSQ